VSENEKRATVTKPHFEQVMAAILHVGKAETDAIMESEKKARSKKRARKAKKP
jgi:hypothetical protein